MDQAADETYPTNPSDTLQSFTLTHRHAEKFKHQNTL